VESIDVLSPAIAIDQKTTSLNPLSTVGTVTEIYDYLRLLYARIGIPYSPATGLPIESQTVSQMVDRILELPEGTKILLLAPIVRGHKGEYRKELAALIKQKLSDGLAVIEIVGNKKENERFLMSSKFSCPVSGFTLPEIEPRLFSFNSPYGACPTCDGLGTQIFFDPELVIPNPSLSLNNKAIAPWSSAWAGHSRFFQDALMSLARHYKFDLNTPFKDLPKKVQDVVLHGSGEEDVVMTYWDGQRSFKVEKPFEGVIPNLVRRYREVESERVREELARFQNDHPCEICSGHRLKPESLCVKVGGKHIGETTQMTIEQAHEWFMQVEKKLSKKHQQIGHKAFKEVCDRLNFLINVGLDYLTLARESGTLSGGEAQRIRLASQIGSGLSGVVYVLDEPSIGLHQCDNQRLLGTLKHLRDLGNTVIVVEHDEDTMRAADNLIDMGPGAGIHTAAILWRRAP
jgi:excinuclease ABC subunit A